MVVARLNDMVRPPPDLVGYTIQWCGSAADGGLLPLRPQEADDAISGQLQAASSTWEGRPPGPPPGPAPGGASMQPPPAAVDAEGHWGEPMQPADQWSALTEYELEFRRRDQRRHGSGGGRSSNQLRHPASACTRATKPKPARPRMQQINGMPSIDDIFDGERFRAQSGLGPACH